MNKIFMFALGCLLSAPALGAGNSSGELPLFDSPQTVNANSILLNQLSDELQTLDFHAVLVYQNGELLFEEYFSRQDEEWGNDLGVVDFNQTMLHDLRSSTKSIVAALIGIAIAEGKIPALESPVSQLLDGQSLLAYHDPPGPSPLLLQHLLTMTAGFEWNEAVSYTDAKNPEIQMWQNNAPASFALSRPYNTMPGAGFNYNGGLTQVLVSILENRTGMKIEDYAEEKLFEPLGIADFSWMKHRSGQAWGPSGLRLNARDFAKFGRLYLNQGDWEGRSVVPASWVASTFEPRVATSLPIKYDYGLNWFLPGYESDGQPLRAAMAQGNGGQCLLLFPEHDLLIVTQAGYYNRFPEMMTLPHKLARKYILPAVGIRDAVLVRSR